MDGPVSVASTLTLFLSLIDVTLSEETDRLEDTQGISTVTMVAVVCISLLMVVFVISLCGGCTPMEVGSDDHAAAGGRKSDMQYSSVATDVNTQVMYSGTTLPNDPYQPQEQALPYPIHPQTNQNFTGYQAQDHQPTGAGYNAQQGHQIAGANRHFSESGSEPPPPNYFEAMQHGTPGHQGGQPSAPAQQYGW